MGEGGFGMFVVVYCGIVVGMFHCKVLVLAGFVGDGFILCV